jgi:hypothetical protein
MLKQAKCACGTCLAAKMAEVVLGSKTLTFSLAVTFLAGASKTTDPFAANCYLLYLTTGVTIN